jgi:D-sedoheptulose 7-phosphate isomerase
MNKITQKIRSARFVFICGNGGSAATAEHFTNDLFSKGVKAICLNSNTSIMTMIANDFGYEYVFKRQLDLYADPNKDLLIVFSVSGKSKNILEALKSEVPSIKIFGTTLNFGLEEDYHLKLAHRIAKEI